MSTAVGLCFLVVAVTGISGTHFENKEDVHKELDHHSYEQLPENHEEEHLPENQSHEHHLPEHYSHEHLLSDIHKYQPDYDYKYKEHQSEHQNVHQEPAKSYQNFNLHVGPQEIIRIPVLRHPLGHNDHTPIHNYPNYGHHHTYNALQHP